MIVAHFTNEIANSAMPDFAILMIFVYKERETVMIKRNVLK